MSFGNPIWKPNVPLLKVIYENTDTFDLWFKR